MCHSPSISQDAEMPLECVHAVRSQVFRSSGLLGWSSARGQPSITAKRSDLSGHAARRGGAAMTCVGWPAPQPWLKRRQAYLLEVPAGTVPCSSCAGVSHLLVCFLELVLHRSFGQL